MFDEKQMKMLEQTFKRIFAMPITRSTFRELQNTVAIIFEGDKDSFGKVIESLLIGRVRGGENEDDDSRFRTFVEEYTIQTRTAKDIIERGEYISVITSNVVSQANKPIFIHRMRRIDGEEFQFITDIDNILNILNYLVDRVQDLDKNEVTKKILTKHKKEFQSLQTKVEKLSDT